MKTTMTESSREGSCGLITAMMARKISKDWYEYGYEVLYDLDPSRKNVGKIVSWFGEPAEDQPEMDDQKGDRSNHVDLALVKKNSNEVLCLIEIDETNDTPNTLLRDAFGVLFGGQIRIQEECELSVNENTALIVLEKGKDLLEKSSWHLSERMMNVKSYLSTTRSAIGRVFIETFSDEEKFASVLARAFKGEL
jgi:hypothetical protein